MRSKRSVRASASPLNNANALQRVLLLPGGLQQQRTGLDHGAFMGPFHERKKSDGIEVSNADTRTTQSILLFKEANRDS